MYCLSCGSAVQAGSAFCTICGAPVTGAAFSNFGAAATGLRPLGVGERLDATFKAYRSNFKANCLAISVIAVPVAIVEAIIGFSTKPTTNSSNPFLQNRVQIDQLWTQAAGLLLVFILSAILGMIASAACVQIVGGGIVGEEIPWRKALERAFRRIGSILWITFLVQTIWIVPVAVVGVSGGFLTAYGPRALGIVILVVGSIALIPFCAWFYVNQSLAIPVLILEDIRGLKAIRRSFQLVRKSWWSVFFTLLLASLIVGFATFAVGIVFVGAQIASLTSTGAALSVSAIQKVVTLILFTPFTATTIVILAIDMRVRKEGLDLELLAREMDEPTANVESDLQSSRDGSGFPSIQRSPTASTNLNAGAEPTNDGG